MVGQGVARAIDQKEVYTMNKYEVAVVISSTLTDEERLAVLEQLLDDKH